jgi:acetylornithine/succinyldiaminopimelate/putrescine aminotransferase
MESLFQNFDPLGDYSQERKAMNETTGKAHTIYRYARYVSSGKVAFFESVGIDFVLGRREGPFLWDIDGKKRLIDCHCNGGVFNLGHRHPTIVETLALALTSLDIGNHHLISEQRATLAQRLAELSWGDAYTVFGVGGGEAIDLAIKVARGFTGRVKVISACGGYHGHTGLALAAGDEKYRAPFGPPAPGFVQVPFNDLAALEAALDDDTAAVILETVPATSGMPIPAPTYLPGVRELCNQREIVLILDEVQTGLGRTGRLWGFQHLGITPDMMVIGKGLSGGIYPMSATCFRSKYERVFHPDPFIHISTFGGAELGCQVALKVLELSSDPAFLAHVSEISSAFSAGFEDMRRKYPQVLVRLRQLGLMMGIELVDARCGPLFSKTAYDNGLLAVYAYNDPRVVQLLPPLIIDRELAEEILQRVDAALEGVGRLL